MMSANQTKPAVPLVAVTGGLPLGGSSTFLVNFARAMRRRGLVLPIVVVEPSYSYAQEFNAIQNPVHCLPSPKMIYEDRLLWSYEQAARYQPNAILSCLATSSFEILRVVPSGVLRMTLTQSDDPGPYAAAAAYGHWTDVAIGVSKQIADRLRERPELAQARVECISYGIDFSEAVPRESRPPSQPLRIIYLGRLIEVQKRISRIAQLARILEARNANAEFLIVGEGPQTDELRAELGSCRIVQFRAAAAYREIPHLLHNQDVFVLLSDFEGLPLSLLEAMGYGAVPVVSDLRSGISEVVDESRGFRVPVGDVERAAAIILDLARDRSKLRDLSEAGARFVRMGYSADAMADSFLRVIDASKTKKEIRWPQTASIPEPVGVAHPWLFRGAMRSIRRQIKKLLP